MGKKKQQIKNVLQNFDFEKVQDVMNYLDWEYYDSFGVPSIARLKKTAEDLLEQASKRKPGYQILTGGFQATKLKKGLKLEFVLEDYDIYED